MLGLREAGVIRPLEDVYKVAEEQLDGRVLDAKLVGNVNQGWNYDLRVVTEDGVVHKARYDAAHEFLSLMLGVRRSGVTTALQALERKRLISRKRGNILILDRKGLEKLSNGTYVTSEI